MKNLIQQKFHRAETLRAEIELMISGLTDEQANQSPTPGAWSAVQVVAHLQQGEDAFLRYLHKKLQYPSDLKRQSLTDYLKFQLLYLSVYLPLKYRAPKGPASDVPEYVEIGEMLRRWTETRQAWQAAIDAFPAKYAFMAVMKHPFAGRMRLDQLFDFFYWHSDRHRSQIQRGMARILETGK